MHTCILKFWKTTKTGGNHRTSLLDFYREICIYICDPSQILYFIKEIITPKL